VIAVSIENQRGVALICCFDLQDDCEIAAPIALERADVYFKRSYSHLALQDLPYNLAKKVRPFGLNYQPISVHQRHVLLRLVLQYVSRPFIPFDSRNESHLRNLAHLAIDHYASAFRRPQLLLSTDFERDPASHTDEVVLFQCRLWDPNWFPESARQDIARLNENRAET